MRQTISLVLILVLSAYGNCSASILGNETLELDFSKNEEVAKKAKWSNTNRVTLTREGIGFNGDTNESIDLSIETTQPLAIGCSWRPAASASIHIEITPPLKEFKLPNGQTSKPYMGEFYVRYSPDTKHWSSWQVIEGIDQVPGKMEWKFHGQISVPQKESSAYHNYLSTYQKEDVLWTSDEEAAVKWILKKDPEFFAKQIPFIGYLQFLFENPSHPGGQRIEKIKIGVGYGVSGLATMPKDKKVQENRTSIPWRFVAD